jgi:hypothetical protein
MGNRTIRNVGLMSAVMTLVLLGATVWEMLGADSPAPIRFEPYLWIAFFLVSLLAIRVAAILEIQSSEIANVKRQLAERG